MDVQDLLQHQDFVRAVARRLLRSENRVDDVVQDTWVAALEHPRVARGTLRAWLRAVARNFALRKLRDDARRLRREHAVAQSESSHPRDTIADIETRRKIVEAVLELDEPYRSTIVLRYLDGYSAAKVAAQTRVPPGTVRRRTHEGVQRLRARLRRADLFDDDRSFALALLPLAYPAVRTAKLVAPVAGIAGVTAAVLITAQLVAHDAEAVPDRRARARTANLAHADPGGERRSVRVENATPPVSTEWIDPSQREANPSPGAAVAPDAIVGTVREFERPLPGGRVYALRYKNYRRLPNHWLDLPEVRRGTVDEDGTFELRGLPGGVYVVGISCDGRPLREAITRPGRRLTVAIGGSALTGRVLDPVGRANVGALVQINGKASPVSVWVEVGADGTYFADGLPDGEYWAVSSAPGAGRRSATVLARTTTLTKGTTTVLDFGLASALPRWTGTVRNTAGAPIGPGRIQLNKRTGGFSYIVFDAHGRFEAPFIPDAYDVTLHLPGRSFLDAGSIELPFTDQWSDVVAPGARVVGTLADVTRGPRVRLVGPDFTWVPVGEDGKFSMWGVSPGTYRIERKPEPVDLRVVVAPGQTDVTVRETH